MKASRTGKILLIALLSILALGAGHALYTALAPSTLSLVGMVDASQVLISAQTPGRVVRLLVEEGQEVAVGDPIALLDPAELSAAMGSSQAQVASLASQLSAARASAASTVGETRNALVSAQAAQAMAQAALAEAQANRKNQQELTQRMVNLTRAGAVTLQARDAAIHALEAAEAKEKAAQSGVVQAEAAVRGAQAKTGQGAAAQDTVQSIAGQLASARAQASQAETRLGYTRVLAPSAGRIGILAARQGEVVAAGGALATLVDLTQTWVYVALPETLAGPLKVGDTLELRLPGGGRSQGRVLAKAVVADFATQRDVSARQRDIRAIRIKLRVENPDQALVPGMTVAVRVPQSRGGGR